MATGNSELATVGTQEASLGVWTRPEPGSRKPRFTRDDIAAAALDIVDTEGFDALSMRRLAVELDAGTMTLYHYVKTKDELIALLSDAVMGELLVPDGELPTDWRGALTKLAHQTRAAFRRHPWILDNMADDPVPGPNSIRHFDQTMQAVSSVDLPLGERFELAAAVDEYVFGSCLMERQNRGDHDGPVPQPLLDYMTGLIATGEYPALATLSEERGLESTWAEIEQAITDPDRFERNLNRIFDGFEAGWRRAKRTR